jgi:uncharacterized protein YkwD
MREKSKAFKLESVYVKRFILFILIITLGFVSKPFWEGPARQFVPSSAMDSIRTAIDSIIENPEVSYAIDTINEQWKSLSKPFHDEPSETNDIHVKTPELSVPEDQTFSIHNIELGETKADVEKEAGKSKRSTRNEYGVNWTTYHENYHNFLMAAYDEQNMVRGLYTNQGLITSSISIKRGSSKQSVHENLGTPEKVIRKGLINYEINSNGEYDVYRMDNSYVTIFYDKHENNTVTALQIIDQDLEQHKKDFYSQPNNAMKEGFEYQLFDLTNASRVNHKLPILTWDDHVRETARKHSLDMAENQYFDHTNLQGQSPFDRMKEDHIRFQTAGENLAYGQVSSIFAHEGLMNSLGHRKNILRGNYEFLGVGVAFNDESQPYYTENFYSDSPSF